MSLSNSENRNPYRTVGILCVLRDKGASDEEIIKTLKFASVEEMHTQLDTWNVPGWLAGKEPNTSSRSTAGKKSGRRPQDLGSAKKLPPPSNATELFRERLEALLGSLEQLKHMDEDLRGSHFVRTTVDTAPVLLSRKDWPEEVWAAISKHYQLDPNAKSFLATNAHTKMPGGVAKSPSDLLATLISVYALAGGRMDVLLGALHADSSTVGTETWKEIKQCVEGSKTDGYKRDGLKVLARHLATWVRGGEVRPGKPTGLSVVDHGLARRIVQHRKDGLTDEEIVDRLSHFKKEDGTSYTGKDVANLGNLGL